MKISQSILEEIIEPDEHLDIDREDMPQIDAKHLKEFLSWLRHEQGLPPESREISVTDLKPTQNELDTDKADKIWSDGGATKEPIIVSKDNFILDGHHRWLAVNRNDENGKIRCHVIGKTAKECIEIMHDFDKTVKRDIDDKVVEMKISKQIINMIEEETDAASNIQAHLDSLEYEDIRVDDFEIDEENEVVLISLVDSSNSELLALFFKDEELGHVVSVIVDADEIEADELDIIELQDLNPPTLPNGLIDFSQDLSWLTEEAIESILTFGEDEIEERAIVVIRGGKKVKKQMKRKPLRKKRLSAKRKMAIRRGVKKRKLKKAVIARKRKRSLKIRKRAKLKTKPKKLRVVG